MNGDVACVNANMDLVIELQVKRLKLMMVCHAWKVCKSLES